MKRLLVNLHNKNEIEDLREICSIVYISKFLQVIGIEISEHRIEQLSRNNNVVSFKESDVGQYLNA